jgi:hypothetical protein
MNKTPKKAKAKPKVKAAPTGAPPPKVRPEDFAKAFRENYSPPPPPSSVTVMLDPDVAPHFQNARAVNEALRALLRIIKQVRG